MAAYSAMDQQGTDRRRKATKRLQVAQMAAKVLEQIAGPPPEGKGGPAGGKPQLAPPAPPAPRPMTPPPASPGPHLVAAGQQLKPQPAAPAPAFRSVSGPGPKAPAGVSAQQLAGYEKYAGSPLEALARRLARQKAGIHLGGADNEEQVARARSLGLLPPAKARPRRRTRRGQNIPRYPVARGGGGGGGG